MDSNQRLEYLFRYNADILHILTKLTDWRSSKGAMIPWRHFERLLVDELTPPQDPTLGLPTKTPISPLNVLRDELADIPCKLNTSRERMKERRAQAGLTWRGDPELINDIATILHAHVAKIKEICMVYRGFDKAYGDLPVSHAQSYELSDFASPPIMEPWGHPNSEPAHEHSLARQAARHRSSRWAHVPQARI